MCKCERCRCLQSILNREVDRICRWFCALELEYLECASSYKQSPLAVQSMNTSFYYYYYCYYNKYIILLLLLVLLPLSLPQWKYSEVCLQSFQLQGPAGQAKCSPNAGPGLRVRGLITMQNKCNKSQSITITSDSGMLHFFPKGCHQCHQTSTGPCPGLYCRWLPKCKPE